MELRCNNQEKRCRAQTVRRWYWKCTEETRECKNDRVETKERWSDFPRRVAFIFCLRSTTWNRIRKWRTSISSVDALHLARRPLRIFGFPPALINQNQHRHHPVVRKSPPKAVYERPETDTPSALKPIHYSTNYHHVFRLLLFPIRLVASC